MWTLPVRIAPDASVTRMNVTGAENLQQESRAGISVEAFDSIVAAAGSGAEWAWARLLEEIDPVLRGYLQRQGASDPDDLAGETWLHVARSIGGFQGGYQDFRSWVFMIAHHRVIDERRRRGRRPEELKAQSSLDRAAPPRRSAEAEALDSFEDDRLEALLEQLSDAQREVVVLRVVAGFGITEIAEIVGKKPGAVQALQHRAFRRLRKILEQGVRKRDGSSVTGVR